jgi:hypothetical protein
MLKLEEIKKQAVVSGIDAVNPVRIVATELVGENALDGGRFPRISGVRIHA